ncbi:MAG: L,D-transpeptidase [Bdellovibrionaceae bacterium]|nr:L,D-transpeptidase [Pseudobdellovibrionaceae bacterium]
MIDKMMRPMALVIGVILASLGAQAKGRLVQTPVSGYPAGSIVVFEKEKALYFVMGESSIRYPVATGKEGQRWTGYARVQSKHWKPAWAPPAVVRRDNPDIPDYIASGDPRNPMGLAALVLDRDQFAIHGTTQAGRSSIGTAASYGCVRMLNEDIADLYARTSVGALVVMLRR